MIRLENIQRRYVSDEVETTALHDIDLHVEAGEFVAIMGPSGCGKSTLLNTLGTVDRPTGGRYLFGDRDLAALNEKELAKFRGSTLGFVFQSFNLIDELTIEENVALGLAYRKDAGDRKARVATAMDKVGIAHRARHYPHQLSGGQQQRAAIARAIVGNPKLILADEPTGNLDTANGEQVMNILTGLNDEGATIVMVSETREFRLHRWIAVCLRRLPEASGVIEPTLHGRSLPADGPPRKRDLPWKSAFSDQPVQG